MNNKQSSYCSISIGLATFLIFSSLFAAFSAPAILPLVDNFHEGEYLAPRLYFSAQYSQRPLLIHGLINYVPAQWAAKLCGEDHIIVCTRIANVWLTAGSSILFTVLAAALMWSRRAALLAGLAAVTILLLWNGMRTDPVSLHQGAPSVRDLILLCEIAALAAALRGCWKTLQPVMFALAGVAAAVGMLWAYTRGLVGVVMLGGGLLLARYAGRSTREIVIAPATFAVSGAGLYLLDPAMFVKHVDNILYWSQNRDIWGQPFPSNLSIYAVAYIGLLIVTMIGVLQLHRASRRDEAATIMLLQIPVALIFYQSVARADIFHMLWVMPFAYLLAVAFVATHARSLQISTRWHRGAQAGIFGVIIVVLALQGIRRPDSLLAFGANSNLRLVTQTWPDDTTLQSPEVRIVGGLLRSTGQTCTYALNNGGGYYAAAKLPPCTAAMYPVYVAGEAAERRVIADLQRAHPLLLVGHDSSWSNMIDGKTMDERTPLLATWINREYPVAGHVGTVEIRRRRQSED